MVGELLVAGLFYVFRSADCPRILPSPPPELRFGFVIVSFPHYFLQATGHLAEQLKTREWVVARITSITERVVDVKVRQHNVSTLISIDVHTPFSGSQYEPVRPR